MGTRNSRPMVAGVVSLAAAAMVATALSAEAVQKYTATPLGSLGGIYSYGQGINNSGQITGYAELAGRYGSQSGPMHAFLHSDGRMVDLGTYLSDGCSFGFGINSQGHVVGESTHCAEPVPRAFLYADGIMRDLGNLGCGFVFVPGGGCASARGINELGQVTGQTAIGGREVHAFLYSDGEMFDLGSLGGGLSSGYAINNRGQVTGHSLTSGGQEHAFLWSDGRMIDLGTLGGRFSDGFAINDGGQVTGASDLGYGGRSHAFLFSNGQMIDLGTLGGNVSVGRGINNSGQVVGSAFTPTNEQHAFLFADGKMHDLNDLVFVGLEGAILVSGMGINDHGQVVANGCTAGVCQAYRLDPVERQSTAVEYFHAGYGHYFVTALPNEISMLDAGTSGWSRTGLSFKVLAVDEVGSANVCRFWSGQTFAPKSSHFYTPFDWECAIVKSNPVWTYEGTVFSMMLPDASGVCPRLTIPLYRLYNDGKSGAPNHRYTTSAAIRQQMIAQGWIPEGVGKSEGTIGCVPPQ